MGFVDKFFGGGEEAAAKKMAKVLGQSKEQALGYLRPYYDAGGRGLSAYEEALGQMKDPSGFYEGIMKDYETSPAAQFQLQQMLDELTNQSAATGMNGSGVLRKGVMDYAHQVNSLDAQNYLNNILGIFGNYMTGQGNLANMGQQAGNNLATLEQGYGKDIAQAKADQERANAQGWQSLFTTVLNTAGNALMGGFGGMGGMMGGGPFSWGGALSSVMQPYTSMGQAQLSNLSRGG